MRTKLEVEDWFSSASIKIDDAESISNYLNRYYPNTIGTFHISEDGLTMADFLEFVNSESPKESRDIYSLLQETNSLLKEIRDGITKFSK